MPSSSNKKVTITIDGRPIEAEEGTPVIDAARDAGISIPSMCYAKGHQAQNSCLVCVIKVGENPSLVPSCSRPVEEGLMIESESEEVLTVRKAALELILSDHIGDCYAPCASVCPAHMEIPQMLRQVSEGDYDAAIRTVKRDIPFPSILGRVCPEVCEGGCRRGSYDTYESICMVERFVGDQDLLSADPYKPEIKEKKEQSVAIVGSGPTGLTASYYLMAEGFDCTVYERASQAGGSLRTNFDETELPKNILDRELAHLSELGVEFKFNQQLGVDIPLSELQASHACVLVATGEMTDDELASIGLSSRNGKPVIDRKTYQTPTEGVFAAGTMVHKNKQRVFSIGAGKAVAISIRQYLEGKPVVGRDKRFNSRSGKLCHEEIDTMMESSINRKDRYEPEGKGTEFSPHEASGFTPAVAASESSRCLHCDCRAKDACDLRDFSEHFDASQRHYAGFRRPVGPLIEGEDLHLDAGKCLQCGLCVQIAKDGGEEIGLTHVGRGFNTAIVVPFGMNLSEALKKTASQCVAHCPTGAIEFKDEKATENNPYDLNQS